LIGSKSNDEPVDVDESVNISGWRNLLPANLGNAVQFDGRPKITHNFIDEILLLYISVICT
jgi:hypothetical protein